MSAHGIVRNWHDDDGWGVIDAGQTPGGCWAHFSAVAVEGYRTLSPGQPVELEWEEADQDGFTFRATKVWPAGSQPIDDPHLGPAGICSSTLTIRFDDGLDDRKDVRK